MLIITWIWVYNVHWNYRGHLHYYQPKLHALFFREIPKSLKKLDHTFNIVSQFFRWEIPQIFTKKSINLQYMFSSIKFCSLSKNHTNKKTSSFDPSQKMGSQQKKKWCPKNWWNFFQKTFGWVPQAARCAPCRWSKGKHLGFPREQATPAVTWRIHPIPAVVGWFQPHLKNMLVKMGEFLPQVSRGEHKKIFELPPPSIY